MAAYTGSSAVLTGAGDATRPTGVVASASLFEVLGVQPALGRRFLPEEDRPGHDRAAASGRQHGAGAGGHGAGRETPDGGVSRGRVA